MTNQAEVQHLLKKLWDLNRPELLSYKDQNTYHITTSWAETEQEFYATAKHFYFTDSIYSSTLTRIEVYGCFRDSGHYNYGLGSSVECFLQPEQLDLIMLTEAMSKCESLLRTAISTLYGSDT